MKFITNNLNRAFAIGLSAMLLVGCTGNKKNKTVTIDKDQLKAEIAEVTYPLPSPFEVTDMINKIQATYIFELTNDAAAYQKYLTEKKQALNLGVYVSDMAYATTYQKTDVSQAYMSSVVELVKALDLTDAVDHSMVERIEESFGEKDKTVDAITDMFYKAYDYMSSNNDEELSYLILAGTWIEGMYLSTNTSENTMDNVEILKIIVKQEKSLDIIVDLMKQFAANPTTTSVYEGLVKVQEIYKLEEGTTALTVSDLEEISATVLSLRNDIIQ